MHSLNSLYVHPFCCVLQPLLTLNFTQHCQPLLDKLKNTVTDRHRYKFEEVTEDVIGFKMVNENSTEVSWI